MSLRLYNDLAHLWPIISPPEEYGVEAQEWLDAIRDRLHIVAGDGQPPLPTLLELGCGGGHLLSHLTDHFITEAVDISPQMLEHSRRLNPQTLHHVGDMRAVRLGRTFDVVAIHDAVNYMITEADLAAAIATAVAHLNPGGLVLLAPDCVQETFTGPRVIEWTRHATDRAVTFIEYMARPQPAADSTESVFIFIIDRDGQIDVEVDRHTGGLFPTSTWLGLLEKAGLTAEYIRTNSYEGGFGGNLFIGQEPRGQEPRGQATRDQAPRHPNAP